MTKEKPQREILADYWRFFAETECKGYSPLYEAITTACAHCSRLRCTDSCQKWRTACDVFKWFARTNRATEAGQLICRLSCAPAVLDVTICC